MTFPFEKAELFQLSIHSYFLFTLYTFRLCVCVFWQNPNQSATPVLDNRHVFLCFDRQPKCTWRCCWRSGMYFHHWPKSGDSSTQVYFQFPFQQYCLCTSYDLRTNVHQVAEFAGSKESLEDPTRTSLNHNVILLEDDTVSQSITIPKERESFEKTPWGSGDHLTQHQYYHVHREIILHLPFSPKCNVIFERFLFFLPVY